METKDSEWGVNKKLQTKLEKLVKKMVAKKYREDAMDILTRCTDKTVREFLHFALLEDYNLALMCLDFGIDKNTGEKLKNKSFGGWLEELEEWDATLMDGLEDEPEWVDEKDEELLIELEIWDHTCGDGCCYLYGTNIYVNGEQIEDEDGTNPHQLLTAVLNKLGYKNVRVDYKQNGSN